MQGQKSSRFLVIGGGAGGLELAIRLARGTRHERAAAPVTLVDPSPSHLWKPRLHEIAVGLLVSAEEEVGYAEQAAAHGFTFVLGAVEAVDAATGVARVGAVREPDGSDELLPSRTLPFDTAVLAIGSTINDFGVPGVRTTAARSTRRTGPSGCIAGFWPRPPACRRGSRIGSGSRSSAPA